jgi:prefoldin subunit 5
MGYVKVLQEDLDAIDQSLDESTAALEQKINALNLPEADLAAIQEDLNNLKGLHTPAAEPVNPDDQPHPEQLPS